MCTISQKSANELFKKSPSLLGFNSRTASHKPNLRLPHAHAHTHAHAIRHKLYLHIFRFVIYLSVLMAPDMSFEMYDGGVGARAAAAMGWSNNEMETKKKHADRCREEKTSRCAGRERRWLKWSRMPQCCTVSLQCTSIYLHVDQTGAYTCAIFNR